MMDAATLSNLVAWSIQVTLVAIVAALAARLLHIDAPVVRYAWWRIVLVICLVLPLVQSWRPAALVPAGGLFLEMTPTVQHERPGLSGAAPLASPLLPQATRTHWPALIGVALLTGAVLRLAWLAAGLVRLRRLRRSGVPSEPSDTTEELRALIEAGAEIRHVSSLGQPVTFGILRPVVLLPERIRGMPPGVQRAVLAHELWHVRRRDWVWSLAEECIRAAFWFHPAIWYLVSRVQTAREEVVDELAILLTNARRSYLEALLAFADEPTLYPAAPFARRRHLFNRMLLISREADMSPRRVIASSAAMVMVLVLTGWYGSHAFPLMGGPVVPAGDDTAGPPVAGSTDAAVTVRGRASAAGGNLPAQPPRDPRPSAPRPPTSREQQLQEATVADPAKVPNWLELAKLQEARGAQDEAEGTYAAAARALHGQPGAREVVMAMTRFYERIGQFEKAVALLEDLASQDPGDPTGHQLVATFYWEKVQKDALLTPAERQTYLQAGIAATDRALTYNPDYAEALTYKNILLRMQANLETDAGRRKQLLAEADALRNRAIELNRAAADAGSARPAAGMGAPPPPPPPPAPMNYEVDGQQAVRIGGELKPPTKVRDVRPVYTSEAMQARVQGVVIIEALIDTSGTVRDARVLRSIPMLDEPALEAVRQWRFVPTLRDGVPVPVVITVTVNFTLRSSGGG